jgi:NAD(P)H-hydrate epimerase
MRVNPAYLLTAKKAKALDLTLREKTGIPSLILMENAGSKVAEVALDVARNKPISKMAVFCGKGNNGGDGFVAARHLLTFGVKTDIFLIGRIDDVANEARINLEILRNLKQRVIEVNQNNLVSIQKRISKYGLIVDALLGIGLAGDVRGIFRELIKMINRSRAHILSIDIPSGLDATTGKASDCCVKAQTTVTFMAKKRGMVMGRGPKVCGRVIVADLGIPFMSVSIR